MQIPNADRAVIDARKLHGYLLSASHPVGRFKAAFFSKLGYSAAKWQVLEADLRGQHLSRSATLRESTPHGRKYEIRSTLRGPSGKEAEVVSVWLIPAGEDVPRLITAHPGGRR
jgi:hypothetical protein